MRFPNFTGEWEKNRLPNVGQFLPGLTYKPDDVSKNGRLVLRSCNIQNGELTLDDSLFVKESIVKPALSVRPYDVLMCIRNGSKKLVGKTALLLSDDAKLTWGAFMAIIRPNNSCSFLFHYLNSPSFRKQIFPDTNTATVNQITAGIYNRCKTYLPKQEEQQRIASLLDIFDRRISVQNKIIEDLKRLRKRIADSLVRIIPNAFLRVQMRDILNERSERNQSNYPVFSVAVEAGVVDQIQHLGRSFAAQETSHYRVAYYGDVVYTKSPTGAYPFGIIKQSQNNTPVALSPLYGVYSPSSFETGYFLHCFFLNETNANNYLHPLVDKGAKNTMNITNQRFLDGYVPVPKTSALQAIYGLLASIEDKLALNLKIRNAYQSQKTFLLKNLFI